ncbi:hypothetical protein ACHAXT_012841 [Thalassiosira profunda]
MAKVTDADMVAKYEALLERQDAFLKSMDNDAEARHVKATQERTEIKILFETILDEVREGFAEALERGERTQAELRDWIAAFEARTEASEARQENMHEDVAALLTIAEAKENKENEVVENLRDEVDFLRAEISHLKLINTRHEAREAERRKAERAASKEG